MRNAQTTEVTGTAFSVTYDDKAYGGASVYIHATGDKPFTGESIGTLGAIVGHGQFIQMGKPDVLGMAVSRESLWESRIVKTSREDAAILMGQLFLARASA